MRENPAIHINRKYKWRSLQSESIECYYVGSEKALNSFASCLVKRPNLEIDEISDKLAALHGNFAFIIKQESRILAAVDKIRSYPVFFYHEGKRCHISNSARELKYALDLEEIDGLSLLEFRMAGYVTGRDTLVSGLRQLQAGEVLVWEEASAELELARYFRFMPAERRGSARRRYDEWIDETQKCTDRIFQELVEDAAGRPIWVPLSGGLDSRLILCMLANKGYDNLHAFSYGVPGNYEAKIAREVAQRVAVPWVFVPTGRRAFRDYYRSQERKDYWEFGDFLCSVPNMQDLLPLRDMLAGGLLSGDEIIVNGQSGDFITGGHIPSLPEGREISWDDITGALLGKHYSQWKDLLTTPNVSRVLEKFLLLMNEVTSDPKMSEHGTALYEYWEWQERQCKYVVNGQRVYDWLGFDWALPLWETEYLAYWKDVPVEYKSGQKLYRDFLRRWNPYGLFRHYEPTVWRWPGPMISVVPLARAVGLVAGKAAKDALYRIAAYWGHYGYFFAAVGFPRYLRANARARGGVSFLIEDWIRENMTAAMS